MAKGNGRPPLGERMASLETAVTTLNESVGKLTTQVTKLATAEAERMGAATERKRSEGRRFAFLSLAGTAGGGGIGWLLEHLFGAHS